MDDSFIDDQCADYMEKRDEADRKECLTLKDFGLEPLGTTVIEQEDGVAEAERIKYFFSEVLQMPIEWEPAFYLALWKYIEGTEAYMPNPLDYEEVE